MRQTGSVEETYFSSGSVPHSSHKHLLTFSYRPSFFGIHQDVDIFQALPFEAQQAKRIE